MWEIVHRPSKLATTNPFAIMHNCSKSETRFTWYTTKCYGCKKPIPKELISRRDFLNKLNKLRG